MDWSTVGWGAALLLQIAFDVVVLLRLARIESLMRWRSSRK